MKSEACRLGRARRHHGWKLRTRLRDFVIAAAAAAVFLPTVLVIGLATAHASTTATTQPKSPSSKPGKKSHKPKKSVNSAASSTATPKRAAPIAPVNPRTATAALGISEATMAPRVTAADYKELIGRGLQRPIADIPPEQLRDVFSENRGEGRAHEALDIAAPRGTPVVAIDDGIIVKLFTSKPGGLTVYQFDASNTYCYYYAHLDRYAPNLKDGQPVSRGDLIGYVGSTGNAVPEAPHLHLAIFKLGPEKRWWQGTPINPYTVLSASIASTVSKSKPLLDR